MRRQASSAMASVSAPQPRPLAHEADDVIEDVGIVGIDEVVLVRCRAVEAARHVLPREYGNDAPSAAALSRLMDTIRACDAASAAL
ncbi:MAG: hypothetical protein WDN31_19115 [Hyphomicrobium sp.]